MVSTNGLTSAFWASDDFVGSHCQIIATAATEFVADLEIRHGSFRIDVSIEHQERTTPAAEVSPEAAIAAIVEPTLTIADGGAWFAGFRIVASKADSPAQAHHIVTNASDDPGDLDADLRQRQEAEYLGETSHDGVPYRHYRTQHEGQDQFWSVRQQFHPEGMLALKPIIDTWIGHGLPTGTELRSPGIMVTTSGAVEGSVLVNEVDLPLMASTEPATPEPDPVD